MVQDRPLFRKQRTFNYPVNFEITLEDPFSKDGAMTMLVMFYVGYVLYFLFR